MTRLQRAASTSHRRGQRVEAVRNTMAILLAAIGLTVTLLGHGHVVSAILGLAWFAISFFLLRRLMGSTAKQGAVLQEQFDTDLFHLPWRRVLVGDPVPNHDVIRLARGLPIGSERDQRITNGWYDSTADVHHPYDVFISQEQNLAWDACLRRAYSQRIAMAAIGWSILGLAVGIAVQATVLDVVLGFYVPSLAALQLAGEIWVAQRRVADERERLGQIVQGELRDAQPGPIPSKEYQRLRGLARDVQDGIFRTRVDVARVPEWLYRSRRTADERDFGDTAEGHRSRLAD